MLVLHRITPFFIGLVTGLGFFVLTNVSLYTFWAVGITALFLLVLWSRLVGFKPRTFRYWYFVGTTQLFFLSSFGLFLFLESDFERTILALVVALSQFLFAEHVFKYVHLPTKYQAYAIEHVSLVLQVLTVFFAGSVGFGTRMFLQLPLWMIVAPFFLVMLFVFYGMVWVSKATRSQARIYGFGGAVLATELFAVISFLPTGFYANAAALAIGVYLFLGLTRAHVLDKLSKTVLRRYIVTGVFLVGVIATTSRWI